MPEWPYIALDKSPVNPMEYTARGIFADLWSELQVFMEMNYFELYCKLNLHKNFFRIP